MALDNDRLLAIDAIIEYKEAHGGNAPTRRELQAMLGLSGPSQAQKVVVDLIESGVLKIVDRKLCIMGEKWTLPDHIHHRLARQ